MVVGSFVAIWDWLLPCAPAVEAAARVTRRRAKKYRVVLGMAFVSHETGEVE